MTTGDDQNQKKPEKLQTLRGFNDILPDEYDYYTLIKKVARHRLRQSGFRRISTPMMEYIDVFARGIGDTSDIVSKEMFTMESRSGKMMALKPEATAGIMRAYLEHGMINLPQPVQLYCIEPHFRYDRPQKGRFRQFHQVDFEVIGARDASIDAQVIHLSYKILEDLNIVNHFSLQINTLGNIEVRKQYNEALRDYFYGKERHLPEQCVAQLDKNPLRILDSKDEDVQILVSMAPKMEDFLDDESRQFYDELKSFLTELNIPFTENKNLVRGFDYYTDTVFEFWDKNQGAQNAIGGGGRYDGLAEIMGGVHTPAMGVAMGVERIIAHLKEEGIVPPEKDKTHVFVAQLGGVAKQKALQLIADLHDRGVHARGAVGKASMKNQLRIADKFGVDWTILVGEVEVRENTAILRNMKAGTQEVMSMDDVVDKVVKIVGEENLDVYNLGE